MNKNIGTLIVIALAAVVLGIAVFELIDRRQTAPPIDEAPQTGVPSDPPKAETTAPDAAGGTTPPEKPTSDRPIPPRTTKPAAPPTAAPTVTAPPVPASPAPEVRAPVPVLTTPAPPAASKPPAAASAGVPLRRLETFVAGNRSEWSGYEITLDRPMVVRAGGVVRVGDIVSGPTGLAGTSGPPGRVRVVPEAPHLALIARVCSTEMCSEPVVIGARAVLCPSKLGVSGDLQFWINNYVQIDGYQTLASYTQAAGGYRFEVESAPASACAEAPSGSSASHSGHAAVLARGEVLKSPSFSVSSRQNAWKPFFLPLDRPLVIRASGEMQPYERTKPTGPNGIVVPAVPQWTYPGTKSVIVDEERPLIDRTLPYQALIGRLCSATTCGEPFLVGAERTICPDPVLNERLELWINHIVVRSGDLQVPFADLTFQGRRGEYRFEVANAPAGACR